MSATKADAVQPTRTTGQIIGKFIASTGPLLVLVVLYVLLYLASPPFRGATSQRLLLLEAAAIGVVAAGQTFVILTGGIDLSVEAMVSFAGVVAAILIAGTTQSGGQIALGLPSYVAIPIALGCGLLIGMFQGVLITALHINPFIVTLGFRSILLGVSLVITRGAPMNIATDSFITFITSRVSISELSLPVPFIITFVLFTASWVILRHTKFGRYTYAIGGNETAARLSGINVNIVKIVIYGISGLLAAVGGVLVMARLQSGAYQNGTDMTLLSVAAVVIGGTALSGGTGGIWGTLVGVLIIKLVQQGLVYLDVQSNAKDIVIGIIIVLAVALDVWRRGEIKWLRLRRG
ncbi:MAG: ABC transporter permease [Anaerolineae bacterium]|nr:ABC transporter permease [Anaerolineae bacterium]